MKKQTFLDDQLLEKYSTMLADWLTNEADGVYQDIKETFEELNENIYKIFGIHPEIDSPDEALHVINEFFEDIRPLNEIISKDEFKEADWLCFLPCGGNCKSCLTAIIETITEENNE